MSSSTPETTLGVYLVRGLVGAALLTVCASPATAHPHVWVTAASELIYGPNGSVMVIRHAWTFDDMFSTYAVQGIVPRKKGAYSREELAPLAQTNVESLKEYGFFTYAKVDGKKQAVLPPTDYFLDYSDGALVLHFTLPFKTPIQTRELVVEIFDALFDISDELASRQFGIELARPIRQRGCLGRPAQ